MSIDLRDRSGLVLLRAIIWGMAGGFFGVVFLALLRHLEQAGPATWHLAVSTAAAGAVVGAFYSAKRVALVGAVAGAITSALYVTAIATPSSGWPVLLASLGAGFLVGALASLFYERRRGAIGFALAGSLAGTVAGLLVTGLGTLIPAFQAVFVLAFFLAPLTGALFTVATLHLGARVRITIPHWISIGLVAAGIAAVVGVGMWTLAATLAVDLDPTLREAINQTMRQVPQAFAGGLLGGALAGALLEVLSVRWMIRV